MFEWNLPSVCSFTSALSSSVTLSSVVASVGRVVTSCLGSSNINNNNNQYRH